MSTLINPHQILQNCSGLSRNPSREELIKVAVNRKEARVTETGALQTWSASNCTGRNPKATFIVKHGKSVKEVDWSSSAANPMSREDFEKLWGYGLERLEKKDNVIILNRVIGADAKSALPVEVVTDHALTGVFVDNMFRNLPENIEQSILKDQGFTLLSLPFDKIPEEVFKSDGQMCVVIDFERRLGLILGNSYLGSVKKLMFTAVNYILPQYDILPLHCSANEGDKGDSTLILGLSGTGKTTLSADVKRALIGDDEHSWSDHGIANFENGCYAKLIDLKKDQEPEIYRIALEEKIPVEENGTIIENAMIYPDGSFDMSDRRLTANSRTSYLLSRLKNVKEGSCGGHPKTILFLTADANGVLPPVSKLNEDQAMLWFLMGYTSKLAGTETGVTEPQSTFSRFFGEPFMPRHPEDYTSLLREKIAKHKSSVYLINTGWSGGPYGVGKRMDIEITRRIVEATMSGELENVEYREDKRFHIQVPQSCPGVDSEILNPRNTWDDKEAFDQRANKLAQDFSDYFDKHFSGASEELRRNCPGK